VAAAAGYGGQGRAEGCCCCVNRRLPPSRLFIVEKIEIENRHRDISLPHTELPLVRSFVFIYSPPDAGLPPSPPTSLASPRLAFLYSLYQSQLYHFRFFISPRPPSISILAFLVCVFFVFVFVLSIPSLRFLCLYYLEHCLITLPTPCLTSYLFFFVCLSRSFIHTTYMHFLGCYLLGGGVVCFL